MNIKILMRDGGEVRIPSNGESAKNWLKRVRRSGKSVLIGTAKLHIEDIMDAVDEKPRTGLPERYSHIASR